MLRSPCRATVLPTPMPDNRACLQPTLLAASSDEESSLRCSGGLSAESGDCCCGCAVQIPALFEPLNPSCQRSAGAPWCAMDLLPLAVAGPRSGELAAAPGERICCPWQLQDPVQGASTEGQGVGPRPAGVTGHEAPCAHRPGGAGERICCPWQLQGPVQGASTEGQGVGPRPAGAPGHEAPCAHRLGGAGERICCPWQLQGPVQGASTEGQGVGPRPAGAPGHEAPCAHRLGGAGVARKGALGSTGFRMGRTRTVHQRLGNDGSCLTSIRC